LKDFCTYFANLQQQQPDAYALFFKSLSFSEQTKTALDTTHGRTA
jgi:hypothetical protein